MKREWIYRLGDGGRVREMEGERERDKKMENERTRSHLFY